MHGFFIYPNPAHANFTIHLNADIKKAQVEIYNVLGEKIYSNVLNTKQELIKTTQFSPGLYFVQVSDGEKWYTKKICSVSHCFFVLRFGALEQGSMQNTNILQFFRNSNSELPQNVSSHGFKKD